MCKLVYLERMCELVDLVRMGGRGGVLNSLPEVLQNEKKNHRTAQILHLGRYPTNRRFLEITG